VRVEMVKINSNKPEPSLVRYAADQIRAGEVLGMPTDTFYGLAADPFNLRAVDRVYEIKSRSRHKPLSLLIEGVEQAEELAKPLPDEFYKLAEKFWPGPLTISPTTRRAGRFCGRALSLPRRFQNSSRRGDAYGGS
jgi:L-threonylcarbamoyladenylate synthase